MINLSAQQFAKDMDNALNRVARGEERILLKRGRKSLAAVVSLEDLERLEALEDAEDLKCARKALREFERSGEKSIPFDDVCREMVF